MGEELEEGEGEDQRCTIQQVKAALHSEWHCLRMRATALKALQQPAEAERDLNFCRSLASFPQVERITRGEESAQRKQEAWRRRPEQIKALKLRKQFQLDGVLGMPRGL